jgi:hypothetical protein
MVPCKIRDRGPVIEDGGLLNTLDLRRIIEATGCDEVLETGFPYGVLVPYPIKKPCEKSILDPPRAKDLIAICIGIDRAS